MKYVLNESPIKTSNGFNVNNVKVDLDIPQSFIYHNYEIGNINKNNIKYEIKDNFTSNIGLKHQQYKNVTLDINENTHELLKLVYCFNDDDSLIDNIDINVDKNIHADLYICYKSLDDNIHFHNGNININVLENSSLNITVLNILNKQSVNIGSGVLNCDNNSTVKFNLVDISGKTRIYNLKSKTKDNAHSYLNNIYIGKDDELIDLNYHYINEGKSSDNIIEVQGLLSDKSIKTFRGTIDFLEGSSKSIGHENENCLLLSNSCISRSLPILLCHEEDVDGAHSVSSGKMDENKLFYLMSRGIDEKTAKQLIIKANFNHIINDIPEEVRSEISSNIDEVI